jgi:hypothetical protein
VRLALDPVKERGLFIIFMVNFYQVLYFMGRFNIEKSFIDENARELERLRTLVANITDEELNLTIYKEGWTIAVALAHLAFWDQWPLVLVRKWKLQGVTTSPVDANTINETLLPFLLAVSPREAANMAVSIAETLDRELSELSPDLIMTIKAMDTKALNRAAHRKQHLDDIESFLKNKSDLSRLKG